MKKLALAPLAFAPLCAFGVINFEGLGLTDNQVVTGQTFTSGIIDVQFSFSSGDAFAEDVDTGEYFINDGEAKETDGAPNPPSDAYAFLTDNDGDPGQKLADQVVPGYAGSTFVQANSGPSAGDWFLRGPFLVNFGMFTIDFVNGTFANEISFQIWDIDGNAQGSEEYTVEFFDGASSLGTIVTPEYFGSGIGTSLDGLPYLIEFNAGSDQIDRIEITFSGTKTTNLGLAFDNFEAVVPEPSTYAMLAGLAALGLAVLRRR